MKVLMFAGTCALTGATVVAAQPPQPPNPAVPTAAAPAVPGTMVTIEGCVTRESASPNAAAAAREPSAALQYVLTELASPAPLAREGKPSAVATGARPSDDQQRARRIYVLEATAQALDFAPHLNHTVRVTGTSRASMSSPLAASATRTPAATNVLTLDVTTLAKVSPTCR